MTTKPDPKATLAEALAKAQADMKNAPLNRTNPHFNSKYADLASIRDAAAPALAAHGLAVTQTTGYEEFGERMVFGLTTTLRHSSGGSVSSFWPLPTDAKPQQMGSALTYARRYTLAAMVGISAEEDDDGNAGQEAPVAAAPPVHKPPHLTDEQKVEAAQANAQAIMDAINSASNFQALDRARTTPRTAEVMRRLEQGYPDLFQQIETAYQRRNTELRGSAA